MTNNIFTINEYIKCNKQEAYKFSKWYKSKGLKLCFFRANSENYIYFNPSGNWLNYKSDSDSYNKYITFKEFMIKYNQFGIQGNKQKAKEIRQYFESKNAQIATYLTFADDKNTIYYIEKNSVKAVDLKDFNQHYLILEIEDLINTKDLMNTEVKINVPEGYEIDKENSTFECIKFKKKTLTYEDIAESLFKESAYYPNFKVTASQVTSKPYCLNNCTSISQVKKLMAINKLMNIAKYFNKNWIPNWNSNEPKYYIILNSNSSYVVDFCIRAIMTNIFFKSKEDCKEAIKIMGEDLDLIFNNY